MFTLILKHFGFPDCIVDFFSKCLIDKSTQYFWNSFLSSTYNADIGIEQDSTLFSILLALYIVLFICIFELRTQALNLNTSILPFFDNGLLISQRKTYNMILLELYSSYRVVTNLMVLFGLIIKYEKLEIFYFSRVHNNSNNSNSERGGDGIVVNSSTTLVMLCLFLLSRL